MKYGFTMTLAAAVLGGALAVGCDKKDDKSMAPDVNDTRAPKAKTDAGAMMDKAGDKMGQAGQNMTDAAKNAGAAAKEKAGAMTDKAGDKMNEMGGKMRSTTMPSTPEMK